MTIELWSITISLPLVLAIWTTIVLGSAFIALAAMVTGHDTLGGLLLGLLVLTMLGTGIAIVLWLWTLALR